MIELIIEELLYALALSKNKEIEIIKISFELTDKLTIEIK
jgi:hypothetical protein